jgi:hypothetical protein
MIYLAKMFIIFSECSAESMQGYDTSLIYLNWMQVYQLAIDTILFYHMYFYLYFTGELISAYTVCDFYKNVLVLLHN